MVKRIITVVRRPDVSGDEFRRIYLERHAPIVAQMPGLLRYKQNATLPDAAGVESPISGIAEVWYADDAAFAHAMASPQAAAANASLTTFVDPAQTRVYAVHELVTIAGETGA